MRSILNTILSLTVLVISIAILSGCGHNGYHPGDFPDIFPDRPSSDCEHSGGEPTCTLPGICEKCGEAYILPNGHTEVTIEAVEATCTKTGLTEGRCCSVCDAVIAQQTEVPLAAHTYDGNKDSTCNICGHIRDTKCKHKEKETLFGKEATCTEAGLTNGEKCKKCGEIIVAQEVITALGHTEVHDAAVNASCTQTGLTDGAHCSECGEVLVKQIEIPKTAHT